MTILYYARVLDMKWSFGYGNGTSAHCACTNGHLLMTKYIHAKQQIDIRRIKKNENSKKKSFA